MKDKPVSIQQDKKTGCNRRSFSTPSKSQPSWTVEYSNSRSGPETHSAGWRAGRWFLGTPGGRLPGRLSASLAASVAVTHHRRCPSFTACSRHPQPPLSSSPPPSTKAPPSFLSVFSLNTRLTTTGLPVRYVGLGDPHMLTCRSWRMLWTETDRYRFPV